MDTVRYILRRAVESATIALMTFVLFAYIGQGYYLHYAAAPAVGIALSWFLRGLWRGRKEKRGGDMSGVIGTRAP